MAFSVLARLIDELREALGPVDVRSMWQDDPEATKVRREVWQRVAPGQSIFAV